MTRRAVVLVLSMLGLAAVVLPGAPARAGQSHPDAFAATTTVARDHLINGQDVVVDSRTVSVSVSATTELRAHQSIDVSWTGAHPTGGVVADQNSGDAKNEEYPVVVLECRGLDNGAAAPPGTAAVPLDPTTCWTATSSERFQDSFNTAFPPWRLDRYATPSDRQAVARQPQPRPTSCFVASPAEHWVPFVAVNGTTYGGGSNGCGGQAPEAANVGGLNLPSNTTYGVTRADGSGSVKFDVWTSEINASLGCSATVACSLVVVPIAGISCDVAGASLPTQDQAQPADVAQQADGLCQATGKYQPGQLSTASVQSDLAVSGALWWATSNWRNRISVPLGFATSSDVCDVVDRSGELDIYGSELMTQAMLQWAPRFCLDQTLFRLKHVQTPEPQARNLLANGGIQAVFTSDVSDPSRTASTIVAPVAMTGFAIAFTIDDAAGNPLTTLRLTPRLLAKLLTESYPAINAMKSEYPALATNPLNITLDPEFIALNPGVQQGAPASQSASTLLALSSDSDVMAALTAYIGADPEARAWLDGAPDPWGMVVNPNYRGIRLPTATWPLLDTFEPPLLYASDTNDCLFHEPVPYLPLVAAPVSRLQTIALDMQFSLANSQTVCKTIVDGSLEGEKLIAIGRQTIGFRFMLGITSLADASRYGLATASLQTQISPAAPAVITSSSGRTFVEPSDAALAATAALLVQDPATSSWPIPYASMRTDPGWASAYPGAMVVYAQVPRTGLAPTDAANLATFLRFAAGDGQVQGSANGQLPPGYLPLTAANHMEQLAAGTNAAAAAVAAQIPAPPATVAPPTVTRPPVTVRPSTSGSGSRPVVASAIPVVTPTGTIPLPVATDPTTTETADTTPPPPPTTTPTASTVVVAPRRATASAAPVAPGPTLGVSSDAGRAVPVLLLVGLLGMLGAAVVNLLTSRRART